MSAGTPPVFTDPRLTLGALRWSESRAVAVERRRLLALLRRSGPGPLTALLAGGVLGVAMSTLNAYAVGWLVSTALGTHRLSAVVAPVAAVVALVALGQLSSTASEVAGAVAARRVDGAIRRQVREIALAPDGIGHLDDTEFRDDIERACDLGLGWRNRSPGNAAIGQLGLVFRLVGGFSAAVVLGSRFPLLAVAILPASLFVRMLVRRQWTWLAEMDVSEMGDSRRAQYLTKLGSDSGAAKDVRLFGMADWIVARMSAADARSRTPGWLARTQVLWHQQGTSIVVALGTAGAALAVIGDSGVSAGVAARCLTAAFLVMQLSVMGPEAFDIDYGVLTIRALDRVVARHVPAPRDPAVAGPVPAAAPRVRFEDVSFTYPGAERATLHHLDLEIAPGEVLAIVGVNGAGKTTLIKLLAGLYPPTSGRILVDGIPLSDLDPLAWRRRMTALFQDFVHYGTTVADNVALSAPEHLEDSEGVLAAIRAAGAEDLVTGLPLGVATTLWKGGEGSRDLSGGQWQKLAIARALFAVAHGRRLLVLDEPTAHLDVEAEQEFNDRVTASAEDASVVLISHRLSNVRTADRIVVLDDGRITESGDHNALMRADGTYARLFALQSSRFAEAGK